jgi:hypothetical protein
MQAVAALRELVTDSNVPAAVRLRACLAILEAAGAMKLEAIGPTSVEEVQAEMDRLVFLGSLSGF